jgi:hypothetical protein
MLSYLPHRRRVNAGALAALCGVLLLTPDARADRTILAPDASNATMQQHPELGAPTGQSSIQCVKTFRVQGVARTDVLYVRAAPRVPAPRQQCNKKIGIPADARGIEDLGPAEGDWRLVRYMNVVGYARGKYLSADVPRCFTPEAAARPPLSGRRLYGQLSHRHQAALE